MFFKGLCLSHCSIQKDSKRFFKNITNSVDIFRHYLSVDLLCVLLHATSGRRFYGSSQRHGVSALVCPMFHQSPDVKIYNPPLENKCPDVFRIVSGRSLVILALNIGRDDWLAPYELLWWVWRIYERKQWQSLWLTLLEWFGRAVAFWRSTSIEVGGLLLFWMDGINDYTLIPNILDIFHRFLTYSKIWPMITLNFFFQLKMRQNLFFLIETSN